MKDMSDMCLCRQECCPIKYKCLRYMARPAEVQSYTKFQYDEIKKECKHFI